MTGPSLHAHGARADTESKLGHVTGPSLHVHARPVTHTHRHKHKHKCLVRAWTRVAPAVGLDPRRGHGGTGGYRARVQACKSTPVLSHAHTRTDTTTNTSAWRGPGPALRPPWAWTRCAGPSCYVATTGRVTLSDTACSHIADRVCLVSVLPFFPCCTAANMRVPSASAVLQRQAG